MINPPYDQVFQDSVELFLKCYYLYSRLREAVFTPFNGGYLRAKNVEAFAADRWDRFVDIDGDY
jgi:hypothetical protein